MIFAVTKSDVWKFYFPLRFNFFCVFALLNIMFVVKVKSHYSLYEPTRLSGSKLYPVSAA